MKEERERGEKVGKNESVGGVEILRERERERS